MKATKPSKARSTCSTRFYKVERLDASVDFGQWSRRDVLTSQDRMAFIVYRYK
ncbi:hypothetical protein SH467x_003708 [Pirellulaceae bacterium SH467]